MLDGFSHKRKLAAHQIFFLKILEPNQLEVKEKETTLVGSILT